MRGEVAKKWRALAARRLVVQGDMFNRLTVNFFFLSGYVLLFIRRWLVNGIAIFRVTNRTGWRWGNPL